LGECGEQQSGIRVGSSEVNCTMQRDYCFPSSGRTRDASRPTVIPFHQEALRGMEKDGPLLPRILERPLQFCLIVHHAEAALCVGMLEWVGISSHGPDHLWCNASS